MFRCVLLLFVASCNVLGFDESNIQSDEFFRTINVIQSAWKSGRNFHPGSFAKNLLSVLPMREERLPLKSVQVANDIPASFDARTVWKRCSSIWRVKDQGNCASAWAMVPAGVMNDRTCILEKIAEEISSQNVLSCCKVCGTNCYGGYVTDALKFIKKRGSVTKRCHPYEIFGCQKLDSLNCPEVRTLAPRCRINCRRNYAKKPFQDMKRASAVYSVANVSDVIKSEIMTSGPVVALIDVYEDFLTYKRGVYCHTAGRLVAQHPVKVVGWGSHEGRDYWISVNTWSALWGDRGVVKIALSSAGVNLENRVFAVTP